MNDNGGAWDSDGMEVLILLLPIWITWLLVKWTLAISLWLIVRVSQAIYRWAFGTPEMDERYGAQWRAGYDRARASAA